MAAQGYQPAQVLLNALSVSRLIYSLALLRLCSTARKAEQALRSPPLPAMPLSPLIPRIIQAVTAPCCSALSHHTPGVTGRKPQALDCVCVQRVYSVSSLVSRLSPLIHH